MRGELVGVCAGVPGWHPVYRLSAHNAGRGAKYTRGRGPVTLRYREETLDKPAALRREAAIKRLSRAGKQALIAVYNKENKDEI